MKKIYNLLGYSALAIILAFASCKPLDKTFDELGPKLVATAPTSLSLTLADADYGTLPSNNPAQTAHFFVSATDGLNSIPTILNSKYPTAINQSQVTVTFPTGPVVPSIKLADSVFTHIAYTLTNADYLLLPNNTHTDFTDTQIISWFSNAGNPTNAVGTSFGSPVNSTLALTTFNYFAVGTTTVQTFSYLYTGGTTGSATGGSWRKIYTITPAQYASIGKGGTNNDFASADAANLSGYFNSFLKTDPAVASTAHVGDVQYVSYKYYGGSTANTFQRVMPMAFDGTNWVASQKIVTATFTKTNGTWVGVLGNGTNYTLSAADYNTIAAIPNIAIATTTANLASFHNFSLTLWTDAQINQGIIAILKAQFSGAKKDQIFNVTYAVYGGTSPTVTKIFTFNGTDFIVYVDPNNTAHTLGAADFAAIAASTIGTDVQRTSVGKYGDFDNTWAPADIKSAMILVLTNVFPTPQANLVYTVTYLAFANSVSTPTTLSFKFVGNAWVQQ